ncbi:O-antigen ligase family protein [Geojedonia litorea]|uniref:O-antigen ligase family protein n=1 Tax=Geojedonia litorea TaxID=1268269 RepID=A0ABV9N5W3_9FLAO
MALPMVINNIAIVLFSIYGLIHFKKSKVKLDFQSLFFPILFTLSLISLIYASDLLKGLKALEKTLVFILLYLTLTPVSVAKNEVLKVLRVFAYVNVVLILICLATAAYKVLENGTFIIYNPENFVNENYFLYHRFSAPIEFHAVYLGIYSVFSTCILIFDLKNKGNKIWSYLMLIVLLSGIILLNSFSVIVSCFIILCFYFVHFKQIKFNKWARLFIVILLVIIVGLFYYKAKGIDENVFRYNLEDNVHNPNWNSLNIRLAKWECALEVFKNNMFLGVGVGNGQTELNNIYSIKNFELGISNKFSTHNQYLHYLIELGLIGTLVFIFGVLVNLFKSVKESNFLLFALVVLLSVCSITENVLTLNKGIVFFVTFYYLVLQLNRSPKSLN